MAAVSRCFRLNLFLWAILKNFQIHVTEFYLLERALNSNWKWFHQTQHNVMNKREFTEGIEVLRVIRKICLNPPPPKKKVS